MNEDRYPTYLVIPRLLEVLGFAVAVAAELFALAIWLNGNTSNKALMIGLGVLATAIAVYLEYRQRQIYASNSIEHSILAAGFQAAGLNAVAKLRHHCVQATPLIIVVGLLLSVAGFVAK